MLPAIIIKGKNIIHFSKNHSTALIRGCIKLNLKSQSRTTAKISKKRTSDKRKQTEEYTIRDKK